MSFLEPRRLGRRLGRLLGRPDHLGRAGRGDVAATVRDALHLLDVPGCPICRTAEAAARRWFTAFENETRTDLGLRERLERSYGFCAAHTRQLFDSGAAVSWLARWVFTDVTKAAYRALDGRAPGQPYPCPACTAIARTSEDDVRLLAAGLGVPEVRAAYHCGDGLCLRHGIAVLGQASPSVVPSLAGDLAARITARPTALIGGDPDRSRRRACRDQDQAGHQARDDGCRVCAVVVETERDYLTWLAAGPEASGRERTLCPGHLADLPTGPGVDRLYEHNAGLWHTELSALADAGGSPRRVARAVDGLGRRIGCHVHDLCAAAVDRAHRLLDLLVADPVDGDVGSRPDVCLRHAVDPGVPAAWRQRLRARLGLLAFELEESERKTSWDGRWETKGSETDAWRRAPSIVDGLALRGALYPAGLNGEAARAV